MISNKPLFTNKTSELCLLGYQDVKHWADSNVYVSGVNECVSQQQKSQHVPVQKKKGLKLWYLWKINNNSN
jgi:hypothetical protein